MKYILVNLGKGNNLLINNANKSVSTEALDRKSTLAQQARSYNARETIMGDNYMSSESSKPCRATKIATKNYSRSKKFSKYAKLLY